MSTNIYWAHEVKSYTYVVKNNFVGSSNVVTLLTATPNSNRFVSSVICLNVSNIDAEVSLAIGTGGNTLAVSNIINRAMIPPKTTAILSDLQSPIYLQAQNPGANRDLVFNSPDNAQLNFTVTYHEITDNSGF